MPHTSISSICSRKMRKPLRMRYYRIQSEILYLSMLNVYSLKLWLRKEMNNEKRQNRLYI